MSSAEIRAASTTPLALAMTLPCVSTTPFGSLVEPEENWMNATSSGRAWWTWPAREMSLRSSTRKARERRPSNVSDSFTCAAKAPIRSSERRSV